MSFVVSAGQLRKLEPPSSSLIAAWPGYAAALSRHRTMTYGEIYRRQPAVRTVVSFLARNLAQIGIHAYRRLDDNDRERLIDHPIATLLAAPNPRTTMYRFIRALVSDMAVYDDSYWIKVRADAATPVVSLKRVSPRRVEPLGPEWTDAEKYRIHGSTGFLELDYDQVLHLHGWNPDDARVGCSPIEALRQVLAEEYAAAQWREQMWSNGARMTGYIERPLAAPDWSYQAKQNFRADWQAQYSGEGPHVGGTPVLDDGMKWVAAGINPKEAQYVEARKLTREEVAAEYHIPQPMVGILDHATFSNIREQHKQLYQDTLGPWCAEFEQEFGLQLIPDLPDNDRVYVEFNIAEKLQGSFEEQAAMLQAAVGGPFMTRNEARGRSNLPRIEGADELIVPLNVTAGPDDEDLDEPVDDEPEAAPPAPDTEEDEDED